MSSVFHRFLLLLIFPLVTIRAAEERHPKLIEVQVSPKSTFKVVFYAHPSEHSREREIDVWLEAVKADFKTQHLATYQSYNPELLISDDDNFIAVNIKMASNITELHVFSLSKDGLFQERKKDFWTLNLKQMKAQLKLSKLSDLDHLYCYAVCWSREGVLLAALSGHGDIHHSIRSWYFIYDVKKDQVLWDPATINKILDQVK